MFWFFFIGRKFFKSGKTLFWVYIYLFNRLPYYLVYPSSLPNLYSRSFTSGQSPVYDEVNKIVHIKLLALMIVITSWQCRLSPCNFTVSSSLTSFVNCWGIRFDCLLFPILITTNFRVSSSRHLDLETEHSSPVTYGPCLRCLGVSFLTYLEYESKLLPDVLSTKTTVILQ